MREMFLALWAAGQRATPRPTDTQQPTGCRLCVWIMLHMWISTDYVPRNTVFEVDRTHRTHRTHRTAPHRTVCTVCCTVCCETDCCSLPTGS